MVNELIMKSSLEYWSKDGFLFFIFDYKCSEDLVTNTMVAHISPSNAQLRKI